MTNGKIIMAAFAAVAVSFSLSAQSQSFELGKWSEIQNSVMRGIARHYVDSLPVDKMYTDGINKMLSDLDPYTVYVPESEQENFEMMISNTYGGIGAIISKPQKEGYVTINEPYENSPAARAGLRCGDVIMTVDGKTTQGLTVSESSSRMKGKPGTVVTFTVKKVRTGLVQELKIARERIHIPNVEYYGMLDAVTGYIYQTGFTENTALEVKNAVLSLKKKGMKRLVLDLRGNGGGILDEAVREVGLFVPKGTLVVTSRGTDGVSEYKTPNDPIDKDIPIMVMVDSGSASASEIVSGAIQDLDRGVIAGERTFGKGLVQKMVPVSYNGQLKVTTAKYYTPSGRCVQAKDYSRRREDGSVGNIPDSLTKEFKTAKGRAVRDGGGITPDLKIKSREFSRITYAVVLGQVTSDYAIEYVKKHETIPSPEVFALADEEYSEFVEWAKDRRFDCRSESATYLDLLKQQLAKDKTLDDVSEQVKAIENLVKMDKKTALERYKAEIKPFIEEEIAVRYYFQKAGPVIRLKGDTQLAEALKLWK